MTSLVGFYVTRFGSIKTRQSSRLGLVPEIQDVSKLSVGFQKDLDFVDHFGLIQIAIIVIVMSYCHCVDLILIVFFGVSYSHQSKARIKVY